MKKQGMIFWFTGLSGSGKTTIAEKLKDLLTPKGQSVLIFDGDVVRSQLHRHLGFSEKDIKENNALIVDLCQEHRDQQDLILVPIISPYRVSRAKAREKLGKNFYEIYFSAPLSIVMQRDVRGLYAKAKRGEINRMIGYAKDSPYEPPLKPDLVIDSGRETIEYSVLKLSNFFEHCQGIKEKASVE